MADDATDPEPAAEAAAGDEVAAAVGRRWSTRRFRQLGQVLLALFVLNTFALPQLAGTREAISLVGDLNPLLLVAGTAAEVASLACLAHLIRTLLPVMHRPTSWTVNRVVLSARAASRVVPGGAAAGGVLSYRLLRRAGVPTAEAGFSIGTQSLESAGVLIAIFFVAMAVSIPLSGLNVTYIVVASAGILVLAFLAGPVIAVTKGQDGSIRLARRGAELVRVLDPDRVEALLRTLGSRLHELAAQPREFARHLGWSAGYWLLDALALAIFLAAYGHWTRPDALLVAFGLANIVATLPITPGGLGVMEVTLSAALVGFGVPSGIALLGVVSWRLVNYWLPIPAGLAAYLSLRIRPPGPVVTEIEALTDEARAGAQEILPWRHRSPSPPSEPIDDE